MTQTSRFSAVSLWYEQRPLRERIMLLVVLLVALAFLCNLFLLRPLDVQRKQLQNRQSQLETQLVELDAREQLASARRQSDPDLENRRRLGVLQAELDKQRTQLDAQVVSLISPQEMPDLLRELLRRQQQLRLLSLENLPAEELKISEKLAENTQVPRLFRHRLRIEFAGDYLSTLQYLRQLETLPRTLVWDGLHIETLDYPQARVRLDVYTLSLAEGWIGG